MSDIIKYDEQRILKLYREDPTTKINKSFFDSHYVFLESIEDLSEEFHRKYCSLYSAIHWSKIVPRQTNLSEQFYVDFLYKLNDRSKARLIIQKKLSEKSITKHIEHFTPEVWKWVYSNV